MKHLLKSKFLLVLALTALLAFALGACSNNDETPDEDDSANALVVGEVDWNFYTERAESFLLAMASNNFDEAQDMLNAEMIEALDSADIELQDIWESNLAQAGAFLSIYETEYFAENGFYFVEITLRHEYSGILERIALTEDGLVAGWHTLFPSLEETDARETAGFTDYPIIIGEGTDFPLNGMLSMPDDVTGLVPAVVIVQGSGPHNMDGSTIGNSTIYRDIAEFLAANGIAVVRYDKRTYAHIGRMVQEFGDSITVREEVIEDAVFAAELLRADPRIDENSVFIIGHSLGGMLAPRIHAEGGDFAGLILMAGSPRHLLELMSEQFRASVSGMHEQTEIEIEAGAMTREEAEEALEAFGLDDFLAEAEAMDALLEALFDMPREVAKETSTPVVGGMMPYYLWDFAMHPFTDYVHDIDIPILVIQGSRDFQILADVDFVLLQELFAEHDNVTFNLYENLNHIFFSSTAINFNQHAAEIVLGSEHVDTQALQDIVDWILGR